MVTRDAGKMPAAYLERQGSLVWLRTKTVEGKSRCIALEGTLMERVACNSYENRPTVCRKFERGSAACLQAIRTLQAG